MGFFIFLLIVLILGALYLLSLRCRSGSEGWEQLDGIRFAHRGLHENPDFPENSMLTFEIAASHGFGAELDVRLSADGCPIVLHDSNLQEMTGVDLYAEDLTAEELQQYRLTGTDEKIPLLEEVLALFEGRTPILIDLKTDSGNAELLTASVMELLDRYEVTYLIQSEDHRCLKWLRDNRPEVLRGQVMKSFLHPGEDSCGFFFDLLHSCLLTNFLTQPDFISCDYNLRRNPSVVLCRWLYGAEEFSWTVSSRSVMKLLEEKECRIIFEHFDPEE